MRLYQRIMEEFEKSNFVTVEIIGQGGSGKSVLVNHLLTKFKDDWTKDWVNQGIKRGSILNSKTVQIYEDHHYQLMPLNNFFRHSRVRQLLDPVEKRHYNKLLRIIVTNKLIQIIDPDDPDRSAKPTLVVYTSMQSSSREEHRVFIRKYRIALTKKRKTRPYLIATSPTEMGMYKVVPWKRKK